MPSLKQYRDRIASVKSTRKITSAMKMVAASKLKKAQDQAEAAQPYAAAMAAMMARVAANVQTAPDTANLMSGTGKDDTHLIVVVTSDRGLCGGFNSNLIRRARLHIKELLAQGKDVKIICAGRKAYDLLKGEHGDRVIKRYTGLGGKGRVSFADVDQIAQLVLMEFTNGGFDVCTMLYNEFRSVLTQPPKVQQLIPFAMTEEAGANDNKAEGENAEEEQNLAYDFEPEEDEIMELLLPKNLSIQIFRAMLDSAAGEQAARMTAMDNATRNAGDMINSLTLQYNRARQASITSELIEIISGAEAL
jgi:F-type H+-transporting ATPase subunit gamma